MKRLISVLLVFTLAFSCLAAGAYAISDESDVTDLPIVFVTGYGAADLKYIGDDGTEEQIWHPDFDAILKLVLQRIAKIGAGLGAAVFGMPDYLAKTVGEELPGILGKLACNDDGSSKYNVDMIVESAEETNSQVLLDKYGDERYQFEQDIAREMRKYVGRDQFYNFTCDWRMGAVDCATRLDEYIQQVKEYSRSDKVNIFAVSHGGQITATYLALFGSKQDVKNACLTVPAIRGAGIVYDLLREDVKFDELNLIRFIEHGMQWENDYHWLVEAQQLGFLDEVINKLIPYLFDIAGHWGSLWDFCPTSIYEEMKDKWLDKQANAEIIRKSDYMHYTVMPSFFTELQKCIDDYGMNVSIIAGTDINMTTGSNIQGDAIIATEFSTGADCTDIGTRYPDGYVQKNECGGRYKLSPSMTVDASTAYLPDHTWFVSGLFHGMTYWDEFTRDLMITLTLTDEIKDVYSDPAYPQFFTSTNPSNAVGASFDVSPDGYLSGSDSKLIVKNLSITGKDLLLKGIVCDGADIRFNIKPFTLIKAGESVEIPFSGKVPEKSNSRINLIISYTAVGSLTPAGERVIPFTLLNGEIPETDGKLVSSDAKTPLDSSPFGFFGPLLRQAGMYNFVSMVYTAVYAIVNSFINLFGIQR